MLLPSVFSKNFKHLQPAWSKAFNETPSWVKSLHITYEVTNLNISVIALMKFVYAEKISNLQTISSSNVAYFLKKDKSS